MKCVLVFILTLVVSTTKSQVRFFDQVTIEFEKTFLVQAFYKDADPTWFSMVKDRLPVSLQTYHTFIGNTTHSIYFPGREVFSDPRVFFKPVADKNIVYTNYITSSFVAQKPIYEQTFLVQDSVTRIKWRVTPDTRKIAGFECRKAIGIIDDTIAIFAFYSEELLINGGPEGIQGLPGMILGVGIPRLHTTWFATKVDFSEIQTGTLIPPIKGKKVNTKTLMKNLDNVLRGWGSAGAKLIVFFSI
jgi:GLPGLI family protein